MDSSFYLGILCILLDILIINARNNRETSACYGTYKNFLLLECDWGDKIKIHKVYQGAKLISSECPYPSDQNSYKEECCVHTKDDCMFEIKTNERTSFETTCNGKSFCQLLTMWTTTMGNCDPKKFNPQTNFMNITYSCLSDKEIIVNKKTTFTSPVIQTDNDNQIVITVKPTTSIKARTTPYNSVGSATKSTVSSSTISFNVSATDITKITNPKPNTIPKPKPNTDTDDSFAFTTGMMGGMAAAIIGLMITIFGFIFYWGRKRRHLTMTKPQTSVWDFLLSQSLTFRPFRRGGYDNFNSHRSSISSDGDYNSPITRKASWTPNIAVETISVEPTTSDDNCSIVDVHRYI